MRHTHELCTIGVLFDDRKSKRHRRPAIAPRNDEACTSNFELHRNDAGSGVEVRCPARVPGKPEGDWAALRQLAVAVSIISETAAYINDAMRGGGRRGLQRLTSIENRYVAFTD